MHGYKIMKSYYLLWYHSWSMEETSNLCFELFTIDISFMPDMSWSTDIFLFRMLNNCDSWSDSAAFLSHQYMNSSINIYTITVIKMNISGTIPINPWNDPLIMAGIIFVLSLIAVGENSMNMPILHRSNNNIKGIILSNIEGTLIKYLF